GQADVQDRLKARSLFAGKGPGRTADRRKLFRPGPLGAAPRLIEPAALAAGAAKRFGEEASPACAPPEARSRPGVLPAASRHFPRDGTRFSRPLPRPGTPFR